MKFNQLNLKMKLLGVTVVVLAVFIGGTYTVQKFSEKQLLTAEKNVVKDDADKKEENDIETDSLETVQKTVEEIEQMSIYDYYTAYLFYDEELVQNFEQKFKVNATERKIQSLTSEELRYLNVTHYFYQYKENPILIKNESEGKMSLELMLRDANALSSEIDSEAAIIAICKKHEVDANGKIKNLTPEIVVEMDEKLFEISDHPK